MTTNTPSLFNLVFVRADWMHQPRGSTSLFLGFKRERKRWRAGLHTNADLVECVYWQLSLNTWFSSVFKSVPMRNKRSICPIFSDSELVVVIADIVNASATVVLTTTISSLLLANNDSICPLVVVSLPLLGWGWMACLFGFGMQGEPDVLSICCTNKN